MLTGVDPDVKFGAILADPPWSFKTWTTGGITHRAAEHHYRTQGIHWLKELPVAAHAAKHCALFMWVVDSHLDVSIELMQAWGFQYKTVGFIWRKTGRIGMGYWSRKQAEICLMGTIGKPKRLSGGVRQVIDAPRREHSRKPDEIYDRVEALVGGPYLEMFARQQHAGWHNFGNETGKFEAVSCANVVENVDGVTT